MVGIAREVIAANGYSDVITVVPKRSTDMTEADMLGDKANILVTEVFDTELIGEGALLTYSHALQNLMEVFTAQWHISVCCVLANFLSSPLTARLYSDP